MLFARRRLGLCIIEVECEVTPKRIDVVLALHAFGTSRHSCKSDMGSARHPHESGSVCTIIAGKAWIGENSMQQQELSYLNDCLHVVIHSISLILVLIHVIKGGEGHVLCAGFNVVSIHAADRLA